MNRRSLLKNLTTLTGALLFLPSCLQNKTSLNLNFKNISLLPEEQDIIFELCQRIIPDTSTPGAKELKLPEFVLTIIDDCYSKKNQSQWMNGLKAFTANWNKKLNTIQNLSLQNQIVSKEKYLHQLESEIMFNLKNLDDLHYFFKVLKEETVFAYKTSAYYLTKVNPYELVPGRYNVHFPIRDNPISTL